MAKLSKAPTLNPVKPLPTAAPPAVSKTRDDYTHHTSPTKGAQARPPESNPANKPRAKIRTLPDTPKHKTKHNDDD